MWRAVVHDGLRHRLILSYEANAEGLTADMSSKKSSSVWP